MSKLQTALAIPIALFALKAFTKSIPETKTPPKPTTNGFTMGPAGTDMDIAPLFPEGLFVSLPGLGGTRPTGPIRKATGPTKPLGSDYVAPDFGFVEGISTLDFSGLAGLKDLPRFDPGALKPGQFTSGLFDPEVQARLRAQK
tara:strand:+ start:95 stop:523 length:429 start_codon:yes stop_codon:yes gene_type:complete